jgi:hypothetical protein
MGPGDLLDEHLAGALATGKLRGALHVEEFQVTPSSLR